MRKPIFYTFLLVSFCVFGFKEAKPVENPNAIVKKADRVRVPEGSYQFNATITNYEGDAKKNKSNYKVYVQSLDRSLVEFTFPAKEKGKSLLMLDEDLWIYLPKIRKPVRIPVRQRLMGNVANGDMTRVNFAGDYNATLVGEERIDGKEAYVFQLVAKSPKKTYNKIKYWVNRKNFHPIKAEFFTVSGKSLKVARFEDFRNVAGALRPLKIVFTDSLNPKKKSILQIQNMVKKNLANNMFNKEYMKTLE